ncbi:serine, glycine, tyrosine and glutamine-rich protein-like [Lontra canadensis]|uniref:serine, glycine, tyrosine and glutamine-rich protein-like n=1 Tax=Lontra canadensis TaxID=76717 RepID=UPI0013F31F1F|nr:serine, glycine, tyrosine and glutamine-rich protein-like [Lontra canadensis]
MGELPQAWGRGPSTGGDWSRGGGGGDGGGGGGGGGSSGGGDLSLSSLGSSPGQGGVADNNRAGNPTRRDPTGMLPD